MWLKSEIWGTFWPIVDYCQVKVTGSRLLKKENQTIKFGINSSCTARKSSTITLKATSCIILIFSIVRLLIPEPITVWKFSKQIYRFEREDTSLTLGKLLVLKFLPNSLFRGPLQEWSLSGKPVITSATKPHKHRHHSTGSCLQKMNFFLTIL